MNSSLPARPRSTAFVLVPSKTQVSRKTKGRGGTKIIAVRIWDWSEWCRQVVRGIQSFAHNRPEWRLFVDVGQTTRPQVYSEDMQLDGVITHVLDDYRGWKRLLSQNRSLKLVSFAASVPQPLLGLPRARVDDAKVAELIGRHLINAGFRRLAYCGTGATSLLQDMRRREVEAFASTHALPCAVLQSAPHPVSGLNSTVMRRWLEGLEKPVGIVTWNMDVARRLVQVCKRLEINVPADISVVAWDDDPMLAETLEPTISAAVLPAERLGFEAAKLLDKLLAGGHAPARPVVVQPAGLLRVRQSSDVWALKDREVHLALQFIRENAARPLKVTQIARHVGISRKKLELDFARVVKRTPYEAVIDVRMELAKQLLLDTRWDAKRIAERSGIGDASTLRRWFTRREKFTPGEYRRRYAVAGGQSP